MATFLNSDISQGRVATQLRCSGIINTDFVANLLLNLSVKEFWKRVNIWSSYGQYYTGLFLLTHGVECGPMPNVTVTLPNIGGALCSTPQSFADAHC